MTTILTIPEVLRHAADNLEAGRDPRHGLLARWKHTGDPFTKYMGEKVWGLDEMLKNNFEYCLAPRTITYTVKDQPEPLKVAPMDGTPFWALTGSGVLDSFWDSRMPWMNLTLARGNIFATKEDAEAADAARLAAFQGATS